MDTAQKPRKFGRRSRLKAKEKRNPATPAVAESANNQEASKPYDDRERAIERYTEAAELLKKVITSNQGSQWGSFELPDLTGDPESFDDSLFRGKINEALGARKALIKNQATWRKCEQAVMSFFAALTPFAKNFL